MAKQEGTNAANSLVIAGIQAGVIGLAAYWLVRATIVFFTPESAWMTPKYTSPVKASITASDSVEYEFSFDPFHRDVVEAPEVDIGDDAPETTLNLKLYGIVAGPKGSAVLKTPDNKQAAYAIDDEIISGVILKAVTPKYIILSQNGRLERLTYEERETSVLKAAVPTTINSGGKSYSVNEVISSVNFSPEIVNDAVMGYKISSKRAGFDLSVIGFKNGDIITRIGNVNMTSRKIDWPRLMASLQQANSTSVTVMRDGNKMTVKVGN